MWFKSNGSVANCSCSRALTAGDSNRALEFSSRQKHFCCKGASDDDKLSKVRITVRGAGGCACTRLLPPEDREGKGLWAHKSQIESAASSCLFLQFLVMRIPQFLRVHVPDKRARSVACFCSETMVGPRWQRPWLRRRRRRAHLHATANSELRPRPMPASDTRASQAHAPLDSARSLMLIMGT